MSNVSKKRGIRYIKARTKICKFCGCDFCDITKRNQLNTCSESCRFKLMSRTRHERGNYVRTDEQNEKTRASCVKTFASRDCFSPELRKKFSDTMKKNWAENRIDTTNHWAKTDAGKAQLSAIFSGRTASAKAKANMSIGAQKRLRTKRETLYSSAKGGFRQDLKLYFRSNWEANFARILNLLNKTWEYECKTFKLEESLSYTPDFWVVDDSTYYEIKGRMDDKARKQLLLMSELFPEIKITLIEGPEYNELRANYKSILKETWEGK